MYLVNDTRSPITKVHVATVPGVDTLAVRFNRPASAALIDSVLGHRIYVLEKPLRPADSLRLTFDVRFAFQDFGPGQPDASVVPNGTYFEGWWLPSLLTTPLHLAQPRVVYPAYSLSWYCMYSRAYQAGQGTGAGSRLRSGS